MGLRRRKAAFARGKQTRAVKRDKSCRKPESTVHEGRRRGRPLHWKGSPRFTRKKGTDADPGYHASRRNTKQRKEGHMANGKTLIRGACVLTMDEELGTIREGDVRLEGDRITAVGRGLAAAGAEVIDGTDCLVLPGFV